VSQHSFTHLRVPDALARSAKTKCTKCGKKGGETKGRQRTEQETAEGTDGSLMALHLCFRLPVLSCSGTVSCRAGSCPRTYHLHCARAVDCAFVGHFCAMYCPTHRALVKQHKDSDLVFQSVHNATAQQDTPTRRAREGGEERGKGGGEGGKGWKVTVHPVLLSSLIPLVCACLCLCVVCVQGGAHPACASSERRQRVLCQVARI
jgi:hypothetical protein